MKYTPIMWEVETDEGSKVGYMELLTNQYHPTVYPSNRGGPPADTFEQATQWMLENTEALSDAELVQRPNALTNPTAL